VVIEAGVVAGYVIAWAVRKARRAAGRLDAEVDGAVEAVLDRLHEVVAARLGADPVLADLSEEATAGERRVSELTRQRVELAVTAAARKDDEFGHAVTGLVARLRAAEQAVGVSVLAAGAESRIFTGDACATASGGGIAFGQVGGDVRAGDARREGLDPPEPGRSRH
jgi:hypothetical protein